MEMTSTSTRSSARPVPFLDRDHSILAFNERVLDWAHRPDVPLLERLRYLCIVSSNLDEFFEVRMAEHLQASQNGVHKGAYTAESFEALAWAAHTLVDRQYALYNDAFMPAFGADTLGAPLFRTRGASAVDSGKSGPLAPLSPGRQQDAELHRATRWQGRVRA